MQSRQAGFVRCCLKCVHVEWHGIEIALVIDHRRVCETVEVNKACDIVPYLFVIGMENVCTVLVYIDALDFFCIDISAYIGAFWAIVAPYRPEPTIR